jgi:hypothetical protein
MGEEMMKEPDYTLMIVEESGGWVVYERGKPRSIVFEDLAEAEWWMKQHQLFHQPRCFVCNSALTRPRDPWETESQIAQAARSKGCRQGY